MIHANNQLRKSIASSSPAELTFTRIYSMLMCVWCEARLHVLIYENGAFTEEERAQIYNSNSLEDKWLSALDIAVRKKSNVASTISISLENTNFSLFNIYTEIKNWISEYFSPVIRNRNKVAHAQWVNPFTNYQDGWVDSGTFKICGDTKQEFRSDNILSIETKVKLLSSIAVAINNIAVDSDSYQVQSFDDLFRIMSRHISRLSSIDYEAFKITIQSAFANAN